MSQLERFHLHLSLTTTSRSIARDQIFLNLYQLGPLSRARLIKLLDGAVSPITVYRTLPIFLAIGVANQLPNGQFEISDRFKQHCHYFTCRICGSRRPFNDSSIEQAIAGMSWLGAYVEDHIFELTGLCRPCASTNKPRRAIGTNFTRPPGY